MKIVKEINLDLDVGRFVREYNITKVTTDEEIKNYIYDYLCGCEDEVFYNFYVMDVFREYIDQIRAEAEKTKMTLEKALKVIEYDLVNEKPVFTDEEHRQAYEKIVDYVEKTELVKEHMDSVDLIFDDGNMTLDEYNDKCFTCDRLTKEEFERIKAWREGEE